MKDKEPPAFKLQKHFNMRQHIYTATRAISVLTLVLLLALAACTPKESTGSAEDDPILQVGDDIAIAETVYGKVQGFILRGIYQFRGIPYGADTGGENRFMPPQPPEPWEDIYPAVWWGNSAPQIMDNRYANPWSSFRDHWNYDDVSEDCLRLNVWTPALADDKKRPET